ncbi:MAG TPA: PEP-CTERM sorting domain-containing protein [Bryobacteraceae bacterium]|nr:PEP-CTERM sorting domain-containing protein [Bryobacteraceae bacterium]
MKTLGRFVAVFALAAGAISQAAPVVNSTGTGGAGLPDPYYQLIALPGVYPEALPANYGDSTVEAAYRLNAGGLPNSPWQAYPEPVHWIAPQTWYGENHSDPWGTYIFRTTFDLTGFALDTVSLGGLWSSDNCGFDIRVNGLSTGSWGMVSPACLSSQHQFTIGPSVAVQTMIQGVAQFSPTNPFITGINTIDFIVRNENCSGCPRNPTGIAVYFNDVRGELLYSTPEPGTFGLLATALFGLAALRRRKT